MNQPKITLTHGATVLDIIEHALNGDTVKARAYAELLLERLEANDGVYKYIEPSMLEALVALVSMAGYILEKA